jgi:hypothetical protein
MAARRTTTCFVQPTTGFCLARETFRRVARGRDVTGADLGNARETVPDMKAFFGASLTDADIVYAVPVEAEGRTRWLCVFKGETSALYVH